MNRLADARIRAAAAHVAAHRCVDVRIGRVRLLLEQRCGRHELAGLAVTALRDVVLDPCGLQRMQLAVGACEAFDRRDLLTRGGGDRHRARAHRRAVQMHGARAALGDAAAVLRADQTEVIPQHPQQGVASSTSFTV